MGYLCEHEFEKADPRDLNYSMTEYDLYARLGLSIRKNIRDNVFEIFNIHTKEVIFSGTLPEVVAEANRLEEKENTTIECTIYNCPNIKKRRKE